MAALNAAMHFDGGSQTHAEYIKPEARHLYKVAALCLQGLEVEGFRAHPAALDAATHFGAVFDTDARQPPRVPVGLASISLPTACRVRLLS